MDVFGGLFFVKKIKDALFLILEIPQATLLVADCSLRKSLRDFLVP